MIERDRLELHAGVFGVLGRLHRIPPDAALLTELQGLVDAWPIKGPADTDLGLARWRQSFRSGESVERIDRDHDRLYGVSAAAAVSPFESVHREDEPLVFGASTLQVRASYQSLGLRAPAVNREPDDHVGLEFDFVGQALARAVAALDRNDPASAESILAVAGGFLRDHLQAWAPTMLQQAAAAADTDFMAGLELLSRGALSALAEELTN